MQVLRLRLNGFKSFVDPTDLVIAPGLTGVVGPNGCGKSNLLEALRWVMGENRPTAMRGAGMEDVIFAGAASRPARAHADVTMTLDNSDRTAPQGMNDSDLLEITRRITRDAGSSFRVNGREARARDVQMLFADASTGAHSPALVRQGQIAELIAAKPRARRRVLEEAAGISGLYQRRHEAELKLNGARTNLERVADVIDGLAQQLAQLARQAKQAARYRDIAAELRVAEGRALYRRWAEAKAALAAHDAALQAMLAATARAEAEAGAAGRNRETAEAAMPALRSAAAEAEAALARLDAEAARLADRAAQAEAAIAEAEARAARATRDRTREAALAEDAGHALARLAEEDARLAAAEAGAEAARATALAATETATERLAAEEARLDRLTEQAGRLQAARESADRAAADAAAGLRRAEEDHAGAGAELAAANDAAAAVADVIEVARRTATAARARLEAAETAQAQAEQAHTAARNAESTARTDRAAAEAAVAALDAEVRALERLDAAAAGDGRGLIDRIAVEPGYEAALGAALGDDLTDPAAEWSDLAQITAPPLPDGAEPLAVHVPRPGPLGRRLALTGVVEPALGAGLQAALAPGQRLVSREGDLWRWDGLSRPGGAANAAADRLARANRLTALAAELAEARGQATAARNAHEAAVAGLEAARTDLARERAARQAAETAQSDSLRQLSRDEAALSHAESRQAGAAQALARAEAALERAQRARDEAEAARAGLEDAQLAREAMEAQRGKAGAARAAMLSRRAEAEEAERRHAARQSRQAEIARERVGWQNRADAATARIAELDREAATAAGLLAAAQGAPEAIAADQARLADARDGAEAARKVAADALAEGETGLRAATLAEREAERAASEAREARARAEATREGGAEALALAEARIREETGQPPRALAEALGPVAEDSRDTATLEADIARLRRQRDALGAVNLRAEEDARGLQIEHDTLVGEKRDLEAAIARLGEGIAGLNREGRARLLTAFETVNGHFATLFSHLFGGGTARLVMVESDDPLEAGLEIMAQPPGKKLSILSLMSGGEQSLTAMALIFAVFLANPAPICVLDEVDAPLDDANVGRFCDLLDEMTRRTETRFLIITHNAITMARMARLFGVTMAEQGVSQLVSVDLGRAESLVA